MYDYRQLPEQIFSTILICPDNTTNQKQLIHNESVNLQDLRSNMLAQNNLETIKVTDKTFILLDTPDYLFLRQGLMIKLFLAQKKCIPELKVFKYNLDNIYLPPVEVESIILDQILSDPDYDQYLQLVEQYNVDPLNQYTMSVPQFLTNWGVKANNFAQFLKLEKYGLTEDQMRILEPNIPVSDKDPLNSLEYMLVSRNISTLDLEANVEQGLAESLNETYIKELHPQDLLSIRNPSGMHLFENVYPEDREFYKSKKEHFIQHFYPLRQILSRSTYSKPYETSPLAQANMLETAHIARHSIDVSRIEYLELLYTSTPEQLETYSFGKFDGQTLFNAAYTGLEKIYNTFGNEYFNYIKFNHPINPKKDKVDTAGLKADIMTKGLEILDELTKISGLEQSDDQKSKTINLAVDSIISEIENDVNNGATDFEDKSKQAVDGKNSKLHPLDHINSSNYKFTTNDNSNLTEKTLNNNSTIIPLPTNNNLTNSYLASDNNLANSSNKSTNNQDLASSDVEQESPVVPAISKITGDNPKVFIPDMVRWHNRTFDYIEGIDYIKWDSPINRPPVFILNTIKVVPQTFSLTLSFVNFASSCSFPLRFCLEQEHLVLLNYLNLFCPQQNFPHGLFNKIDSQQTGLITQDLKEVILDCIDLLYAHFLVIFYAPHTYTKAQLLEFIKLIYIVIRVCDQLFNNDPTLEQHVKYIQCRDSLLVLITKLTNDVENNLDLKELVNNLRRLHCMQFYTMFLLFLRLLYVSSFGPNDKHRDHKDFLKRFGYKETF